jgi:hypothetical protein
MGFITDQKGSNCKSVDFFVGYMQPPGLYFPEEQCCVMYKTGVPFVYKIVDLSEGPQFVSLE